MPLKKTWNILKATFSDFVANRVMKLSAALAYYTIFSLPGLLIIIIWVSDIFLGQEAVEGTVYGQISSFVGAEAAQQIQQTIRNATLSSESSFATIVGVATLVIGATSIFGEIQDSINLVWRLKAKPKKGKGWLKLIINRLLSFSIVVSLGFLLLVSLIINGLLEAISNRLMVVFPEVTVVIFYIINLIGIFGYTAELG